MPWGAVSFSPSKWEWGKYTVLDYLYSDSQKSYSSTILILCTTVVIKLEFSILTTISVIDMTPEGNLLLNIDLKLSDSDVILRNVVLPKLSNCLRTP